MLGFRLWCYVQLWRRSWLSIFKLSWQSFWSGLAILSSRCSDTNTYPVDLSRNFCSYNLWHIKRFPCSHVVACISYTSSSFYDYCDLYFLSSTFLMTLNSVYILSWSVIGLMRSPRLLMYCHLIWNILQEGQRRIEWITRVVQKKRGRWNAVRVIS